MHIPAPVSRALVLLGCRNLTLSALEALWQARNSKKEHRSYLFLWYDSNH
jgi:hypothetical protein